MVLILGGFVKIQSKAADWVLLFAHRGEAGGGGGAGWAAGARGARGLGGGGGPRDAGRHLSGGYRRMTPCV
jgi:hypothetical protein